MAGARARNDYDTDEPDSEASAVVPEPSAHLKAALERLRLQGAIFLRAEYREPWAYESLSGKVTAEMLRPGTDRVVLFQVVASGRCWVAVSGGDRHWASAGDVIVLPYGDQHRMGGVADVELASIETFLQRPPWPRMPVLRHGAGGQLTDVVCGYLSSSDPLFDPQLRVFPPVFVVHPPAGTAAEWVQANIAFALQQTSSTAPVLGLPTTRLPEMLLVEVLRIHLATAPAFERGWVAALNDPLLSQAIALLHGTPEAKWTVAALASATAVSRSLLDNRFRQVLGRSPIRYLTDWRMHLAQDLLASTDLTIVGVAHRVGYDAEEAFSRAFKRAYGSAPGTWRANHSAR